jgi:hypothetical protein
MSRIGLQPLVPGMLVFDASDTLLGAVGAVREGAFRVDLPNDRLWVPDETIFTAQSGKVVLVCMANGVGKYRLPEPVRDV